MKKILIVLFFSIFFISCTEEERIVENIEKQDFFVETKKISDFGKKVNIEKTGKLTSSQDIKLSSQASGRISNIYIKEGEYVKSGDIIARLDDTIANYGYSLEKAKNFLNKTRINYNNTESSLDKRISDLNINLSNLKIDESGSKSSLELGKIENSIKKIALDYDNLKISNYSTISGFKKSMGKDLTSFTTYLNDIIEFSDILLGISFKNKDKNNKFQNYLGAKDFNQLKDTKDKLISLIDYKNKVLIDIDFNFEGYNNFGSNADIMNDGYSKITKLLESLELTLDNSIPSISSLPESQISIYKVNISTFWSNYNINNGSFISLNNTINTFLDTFENIEKSLLKQIELLESDRRIFIKSLDINLELDEKNLEEAISNKNFTLREIDASIIDANIQYRQALNNYNKLIIKSPITGVIGNVLVNVGQEIGINTPLFNISNNSDNEILISFSKEELDIIKSGDIAYINIDNIIHTGSIYSISNVADNNLKYSSRISFPKGINFIGDIVNIKIPFNSKKLILPLDLIKIKNIGIGIINILIDGKIEQKDIKLGKIYNNKIEILEKLESELLIITNYVSNFDDEKFILKIR